MNILDEMGVSKLSAKVFSFFFKVNYSFKQTFIGFIETENDSFPSNTLHYVSLAWSSQHCG